jgi:hypothetical protein
VQGDLVEEAIAIRESPPPGVVMWRRVSRACSSLICSILLLSIASQSVEFSWLNWECDERCLDKVSYFAWWTNLSLYILFSPRSQFRIWTVADDWEYSSFFSGHDWDRKIDWHVGYTTALWTFNPIGVRITTSWAHRKRFHLRLRSHESGSLKIERDNETRPWNDESNIKHVNPILGSVFRQ